jgi:hypothetical protein
MEGKKGAPEMSGAGRELGAACRSVLVRDNPRVRPGTQSPLDGHRGPDAAALRESSAECPAIAQNCPGMRRKETGRAIPCLPHCAVPVAPFWGNEIWLPFWCTPGSKRVAVHRHRRTAQTLREGA